jgi:hypothetical protein
MFLIQRDFQAYKPPYIQVGKISSWSSTGVSIGDIYLQAIALVSDDFDRKQCMNDYRSC